MRRWVALLASFNGRACRIMWRLQHGISPKTTKDPFVLCHHAELEQSKVMFHVAPMKSQYALMACSTVRQMLICWRILCSQIWHKLCAQGMIFRASGGNLRFRFTLVILWRTSLLWSANLFCTDVACLTLLRSAPAVSSLRTCFVQMSHASLY